MIKIGVLPYLSSIFLCFFHDEIQAGNSDQDEIDPFKSGFLFRTFSVGRIYDCPRAKKK
jgi:hypothetical protein